MAALHVAVRLRRVLQVVVGVGVVVLALLVGLAWLIVYYVSLNAFPIPDLGVVAYAGAPLRLPDPRTGVADPTSPVVGVLCAIDGAPRRWTAEQLEVLQDLAAACSAELGLRVFAGRRSASVSTSDLSDDALDVLVERAVAMARSSSTLSSSSTTTPTLPGKRRPSSSARASAAARSDFSLSSTSGHTQ